MHAAFLSAVPQVEPLSDYVALTCTNIWRLIISGGAFSSPPPTLPFFFSRRLLFTSASAVHPPESGQTRGLNV